MVGQKLDIRVFYSNLFHLHCLLRGDFQGSSALQSAIAQARNRLGATWELLWYVFLCDSCSYFVFVSFLMRIQLSSREMYGSLVSAPKYTKALHQLEIVTCSWIIFAQQMVFLLTYFNILAHCEQEWVNRKQTVLLTQQSPLRYGHVHFFFLAFVHNPKRLVPGFAQNNKVRHKSPNTIVSWMPTVSSHLFFPPKTGTLRIESLWVNYNH